MTLGAGLLARTTSRTVRLPGRRGARRPRSPPPPRTPSTYSGSAPGMLHLLRPHAQSYLGQGLDGELHYRDIGNWSAAFLLPAGAWPRSATPSCTPAGPWRRFRELVFRRELDDPDVRLHVLGAAEVGHELACTTSFPASRSPRGLRAAQALADEAGTPAGRRAASNPRRPDPDDRRLGTVRGARRAADYIVDQLHNLPVLARSADPARRHLALAHARWVAANLMRADGSVIQEGFDDQLTGALVRTGSFQGFDNRVRVEPGPGVGISGLAPRRADLEDPTCSRPRSAPRTGPAHAPLEPPPTDFSPRRRPRRRWRRAHDRRRGLRRLPIAATPRTSGYCMRVQAAAADEGDAGRPRSMLQIVYAVRSRAPSARALSPSAGLYLGDAAESCAWGTRLPGAERSTASRSARWRLNDRSPHAGAGLVRRMGVVRWFSESLVGRAW